MLKINPAVWNIGLSNEIGQLAQGVLNVKGNDAIQFILIAEVPKNKKVAYSNMICDHRLLKTETHQVRLTIGGDVLVYAEDASSPAASLLEAKLLLNSVISDSHLGAQFMSLDIKVLFLQTLLDEPEYMPIHSKYFSDDICQKYNINHTIAPDGYVYCKIKKGYMD